MHRIVADVINSWRVFLPQFRIQVKLKECSTSCVLIKCIPRLSYGCPVSKINISFGFIFRFNKRREVNSIFFYDIFYEMAFVLVTVHV